MKGNVKALSRAVNVIGVVLCVVFGAMLLFNMVIIVKGLVNPDWPPSVFGVTPMVVKSGSMSSDFPHEVAADEILDLTEEQILALKAGDTFKTAEGDYVVTNVVETVITSGSGVSFYTMRPVADHIETDDLIFVGKANAGELKAGQVITYFELDENGRRTVVTHRIIEVVENNGQIAYRTKGDANTTADRDAVAPELIIGVYKGRVAKLGALIMFLQQPWGMIIFIGVPVLAFMVYDILHRRKNSKKGGRIDELEAELARLRERVAQAENEGPAPSAPEGDGSGETAGD